MTHFFDGPSAGGNGGQGGAANATNDGTIDLGIVNGGIGSTSGRAGLNAWASGGGGGKGGDGAGFNDGAAGGAGGKAGAASAVNNATITTRDVDGGGITVFAVGGGGGGFGGAELDAFLSDYGASGGGGDGGTATAANAAGGAITTSGNGGIGILVRTDGGSAFKSLAPGWWPAGGSLLNVLPSGNGGAGGVATVTNNGAITTQGANAAGIVASANGGDGGDPAGAAGSVTVTNAVDARIVTKGGNAPGISASAVGGTGGAMPLEISDRSSSTGGIGGTITVHNYGSISTGADSSPGITIDAGGGSGGYFVPGDGSVGLSNNIGDGKDGRAGGTVTVEVTGTIGTTGANSPGLEVEASGGQGGSGKSGYDSTVVFGANGKGGSGGVETVTLGGAVATMGADSPGIAILSQGGAGGDGSPGVNEFFNVGGLGGSGGSATVDITGAGKVSTAGARSPGLRVVSQGGSGGKGSTNYAGWGINGGDGGEAGIATATTSTGSAVSTTGADSVGVLVQSLGGAGAAGGEPKDADSRVGAGGKGGNAKAVTVTLGGSLSTAGDNAHGVQATSHGGTGGVSGANNQLGNGVNGGGDNVTVTAAATSSITVGGANAIGILAQSLAGGITFDPAAGALSGAAAANADAGAVTITAGGAIRAPGAGGTAITAMSAGGKSAGNITLNISSGAILAGGSGSGAGIAIHGGASNRIDNAGAISAASGAAIRAASDGSAGSNPTLELINSGTIIGNIILAGADRGQTVRNSGALQPGTTINLSGGALYNGGTLSPGGSGNIVTTNLTGDFIQQPGSVYEADVNFGESKADLLVVAGMVQGSGAIAPILVNPAPGRAIQVLRSTNDIDSEARFQIQSSQSVYSYIVVNAGNSVSLLTNANFTPAGANLNANQTQVARHLQDLWNSGANDSDAAALFNGVAGVTSPAALGPALDGLASQDGHAKVASSTVQHQQFADNLYSCPSFAQVITVRSESECVWQRTIGLFTSQDASAEAGGHRGRSLVVQLGGQKLLAPGWVLGLSGAYTGTSVRSGDGLSTSTGQGFLVGGVLKRELGAWTLSGSLHGGMEWYETSRLAAGAVGSQEATSSHPVQHLGARLRVAHEIPLAGWYVKPYGDLDVSYMRVPGFEESGAGALGLRTETAERVTVAGSPMLEVGGRLDQDGMRIRPFLAVGFTAVSSGQWEVEQRFVGSPASAGGWRTRADTPDRFGAAKLGMEVVEAGGLEVKVEYGLRFASGFTAQTASLRLAYRL